jgi:hypothetical protein
MTDEEVQPYVGKPARVTLADGRVFAGVLHSEGGGGHGHTHYAIETAPVEEGGEPIIEMVHGAAQITEVADASDDPAASA